MTFSARMAGHTRGAPERGQQRTGRRVIESGEVGGLGSAATHDAGDFEPVITLAAAIPDDASGAPNQATVNAILAALRGKIIES